MTLELRNLTKSYDKQRYPAIQSVDLTLSPGRITAIGGESGSGKTTLLRLIAGFEIPDGGSIYYNGECYADSGRLRKPQHRSITMIFQDLALFPHLTSRQNVLFGMKRLDRSEREKLSASLFQQVNLRGFEDKYPHELSGGQQQRVALARALASRADIILMDEPFSNLDAQLKWDLMIEVRAILSDVRKTVLFVTHDRDEAFFLADDIAVIREGRMLQHGAVQELYERPACLDVARFFGKINCLPGSLASRDGVILVRPGALRICQIAPNEADSIEADTCVPEMTESDNLSASDFEIYNGVVEISRFMGEYCETKVCLENRNGREMNEPSWRKANVIVQDDLERASGERVSVRLPKSELRYLPS